MRTVLYLHGFASSPHGEKPDRLRALLAPHGLELDAPDFNVPSFRYLDFEAMVATALAAGQTRPPAAILGSSLGCLVALEAIRRGLRAPAVFMAPALGVANIWLEHLLDGDPLLFPNDALGGEAEIHRAFFEGLTHLDTDHDPPPVPLTVFMGTDDDTVPYDRVKTTWDRWDGGLMKGSRFITIEGGDHRLLAHLDAVARAVIEGASGG